MEERKIIQIENGEAVEFFYNVFARQGVILFRDIEIRMKPEELEWLCEHFLKYYSTKTNEYKQKYEHLVDDYVKVTSNFISLLANKK